MKLTGDFDLPIILDQDADYVKVLRKEFTKYKKNLSLCDLDPDVIKRAEKNCKDILEAINRYYSGNIARAQQIVCRIIKRYKNNKFLVSELDDSYAFRDFRSFIRDDSPVFAPIKKSDKEIPLNFYKARVWTPPEEFKKEDMYHIPFNKREIIKTQRFSLPGLPCMYFSFSSYGCWMELDRPSSDAFCVASYKINNAYQILNLAFSWHLICLLSESPSPHPDYDLNISSLTHTLIEMWPLVCATSFRVKQQNRSFKSEYIVSQMIMLAIKSLDIEGVAYYSKKADEGSRWARNTTNLAIPTFYNSAGKSIIYDKRADILITPVVSLGEFEKLPSNSKIIRMRSYHNNTAPPSHILFAGKPIEWENSIFCEFDDYLASLQYSSIIDDTL